MGLGKDIGKDGDDRQLGQLGRLQREQAGNDSHRAAGTIDDFAEEHDINQTDHRDHRQSRYHQIQEQRFVVIQALEPDYTYSTRTQEDTLLDDGHIDALSSDFTARRAITLHDGDDNQHDIDTPNPRVTILLRNLGIFFCLFVRRHIIE